MDESSKKDLEEGAGAFFGLVGLAILVIASAYGLAKFLDLVAWFRS